MTRGARPRLLVRGRGRGAAAVKAAALVRAVAAATAVAGGPLPAAAAQPPAAPGGAARFEDLARDAVEVEDLGVLLAPFLDECRDRRELERVRCQTARNFLQARLPGRRFLASRPGTDVISLSEYDAQLKGFRLAVAGCLACREPVEAGARGEKRFVTLEAPAAGAGSLAAAVELTRSVLPFSSVAESNAWLVAARSHLRAEFVFQPANAPWTLGPSRGIAFKPLAVRVFNGCTGEVVLSQPPSRGPASSGDCGSGAGGAGAGGGPAAARAAPPARDELGTNEINQGMAPVRRDIEACTAQFKVPGTTFIVFTVASNGIPQNVKVEGSGAGTALGQCLIDVGNRVRFPTFGAEMQTFKYPVMVRK